MKVFKHLPVKTVSRYIRYSGSQYITVNTSDVDDLVLSARTELPVSTHTE